MHADIKTSESLLKDPMVMEAVRRIVRVAKPERIVLFGSRVKENRSENSDIDLLVIKNVPKKRALAAAIYRALIGVGCPVDIVVATPDDVQRYAQSRALILYPALKEGRQVYAA